MSENENPTVVVVSGAFTLAPESVEAVRAGCASMQAASRAEEGCHDYTFSIDVGDENVLRISETWASIDALKAHFKVPHMADFQKLLAEHPPTSGDVHFYEATEIDRPQV